MSRHYRSRRLAFYYSTPERRARQVAHAIARAAVVRGRLRREACAVCGSPKVEQFHADYRKPLIVRWLCRAHRLEAVAVAPPIAAVDDRQLEFVFTFGGLHGPVPRP